MGWLSITFRVKEKAAEAAYWKQVSLLAFLFAFRFLCRNFLFLWSWIERVGNQDYPVMLHTVFICPFFKLEITLYGQQSAFGQLIERLGVFVLTPCFHVDESWDSFGIFAIFLLTAYSNRETCYTSVCELSDFSVPIKFGVLILRIFLLQKDLCILRRL